MNNGVRSLDQINLARNNTVSLNDKKLLRLPAGAEEVTISRSLLADSKIISTSYSVAGYSGTTYNNANVNVGVNSIIKFKAQEDPRSVRITSSIEESWKKVTTIEELYNSASKPDNEVDPNGDESIYDETLIDPSTPATGPGPWRVKCRRAPDGSMMVHSAAWWFGSDPSQGTITGTKAWFGRGIYNSNAYGFNSPLYTWTVGGGTVVGNATT
ncbi:MAG TPA: hypothetical protein VGB77_06060 [Abditibacteriaceae bacterium]|jgi:hypothetical protein